MLITSTGPIGPIPVLSRSYGNTHFSRQSVRFTEALDAADETTLRTWAAENGHTIHGETPAIAAFVFPGDKRPIAAIDYRRDLRVRLERVTVLRNNGDVDRMLYFDPADCLIAAGAEQFTLAAGASPVVSEHPTYTPGTLALVQRPMEVRWYTTTGTVYATKSTEKRYQPNPVQVGAHPAVNLQAGETLLNEGLAASRRKRGNAIERSTSYAQTAATRYISNPANSAILGAFMAAAGIADPTQGAIAWVVTELQALAGRLQTDRELYIQSADSSVIASVGSDAAVWLDTVIEDGGSQTGRQAMVVVLTSAVGG